jgi:UDP-N-acetyl-D-mannosaminuronic acid dehydrogenase
MTLQELTDRIEEKTAVLGVIGLGYVGLPVAAIFADAGYQVIGVDLKADRVEAINAGRSPIEGKEPGLSELLQTVVSSGSLRATTDYGELANTDVVMISVETPVGEDHVPRFEALTSALRSLGPVLRKGALVIVESTIAPGTMDRLVRPLLEETTNRIVNKGFYLGHCPERVMPGKLLHNIRNVSRVCGGMTADTSQVMITLYKQVVQADLDLADCVTAELVKTAENAYRDVNIAFANELALICEVVGGDVWQVRELVNKSPGRNMLLPGAGVGGHCIPKDPWLLVYGAEGSDLQIRLIPAARGVNDGMPRHMVDLTIEALQEMGREISGAKILVMGYAYLESSDDNRNSPSIRFIDLIKERGAQVVVHDPWITAYQGDIREFAEGCDVAVVLVKHPEYEKLNPRELGDWLSKPIIIDGRNVYGRDKLQTSGVTFRICGLAH